MNNELKRILIAYDGSNDSQQALQQAISLAKKFKSELTLTYVREGKILPSTSLERGTIPPTQTSHTAVDSHIYPPPIQLINHDTGMKDEVEDETERILNDAKEQLTLENIHSETIALTGDPATSICQFAKESNTDVIVIGNRGLSGIKKLVKGSVSEKVSNQAPCSVLIVKSN
ncbi:universal stress protein [Bacillus timonensis]|nr:universal stress protein [Bacillus timonensis]